MLRKLVQTRLSPAQPLAKELLTPFISQVSGRLAVPPTPRGFAAASAEPAREEKDEWAGEGEKIAAHPHPSKTLPPAAAAAQAAEAAEAGTATKSSSYWLMQPIYPKEYLESVKPRHKPPVEWHEKTGAFGVKVMRSSFDLVTGYGHGKMTESKWLTRMLFLETVAGVPGMVGGMLRHLRSLRTMKRDHGWIHTLLEEAENERMHLLTFMTLRQAGPLFRAFVLITQGVFFNLYFAAYLLSPKHCHAFVGYLEEEAIKTYTHALEDMGKGKPLERWTELKAPEVATKYWQLPEGATMRDVILAVRADEAAHAYVNHKFGSMAPTDTNPFEPGSHVVP